VDVTFREIPCEIQNLPSANSASAGTARRPADLRLPRPKMRPRKGAFHYPDGFRQHRVGESGEGKKDVGEVAFSLCRRYEVSIYDFMLIEGSR